MLNSTCELVQDSGSPITHLCQCINGGKILAPPVQHALVKFFLLTVVTLLPLPLPPLSIFIIILLAEITFYTLYDV